MKKASASQIKLLRKLSMRKYRYKEKLWIAEGIRTVAQILKNNREAVLQIFLGENLSEVPTFIPAASELYASDLYSVEPELLNSLSGTDTPQGILALCKMPDEPDPHHIAGMGDGILVALDAIQDPGNLGTIIRTASWFGVSAILAGTGTADPFHPKTVRSTAGAAGTVPVLTGELSGMLTLLHSSGWDIRLLDTGKNADPLQHAKKPDKMVLVFGNEGNGISPAIKNMGYPSLTIPGNPGNVESLNVAMACGICMYHFSENRPAAP